MPPAFPPRRSSGLVEAGVGAARCVDVLQLALHRIERVHAVVAVAVGGQVRAAVAGDAGPEEAVDRVVLGRHVLDGDAVGQDPDAVLELRSEEHTSELQSLMRISYAVFCLKK